MTNGAVVVELAGGAAGSAEPAEPAQPATVWRDATRAFERWLGGESTALDDLVATMTPVLWHVVRAYRLPHDAAEDVVQTTWLTFVRRGSTILDPAAVGGWLTTTARREAWRVAKASGRAMPIEDDELTLRLPDEASAESRVVVSDHAQQVWAAVDELPERCRRLLRIVAFEHRPDYARISADLDMPVGSIGPTRSRCLAKLKVALAEAGAL